MGYSIFGFIIVIGLLVFVHELGHFFVARLCGVGVSVFSLGFGPKVLSKTLGQTEYCLSLIPLGGYVKMIGEESKKDITSEEIPLSFSHKSLIKKSLIVFAGPFFNFLLTILIFFLLYQFSGISFLEPVIGEVISDSPAMKAGLAPGDVIKKINGKPVESFEDIMLILSKQRGEELEIAFYREGCNFAVRFLPMKQTDKNLFGEEKDRYIIGIKSNGNVLQKRVNPLQAFWLSLQNTFSFIRVTILGIVKIISGSISMDNIGGPLMIAHMAGEQAKAGVNHFLLFMAMLSVNLGIINLFPIPVLDGGHLLFFGIEAVTGRPVSDGLKQKLIQFGAALLVGLMAFVFYNDIVRIFR